MVPDFKRDGNFAMTEIDLWRVQCVEYSLKIENELRT